jgi:hypothetical protein
MFILFITLLSSQKNELEFKSLEIRYKTSFIENLLKTVLNYQIKNDSYNNSKIFDLIEIFFCKNADKDFLENQISYLLNLSTDNYAYIFFSEYENKTIWVFNKYSHVCIDEIYISFFDVELYCSNQSKIILGLWDYNKEVNQEC